MNNQVPFLDLGMQHHKLEDEFVAVFRNAVRTGRFIGGPAVEEFERNFARFNDAAFCVGVGSGTDALRFALMAAGVRSGDTVLTVPNTFIATTEAISQAGAHFDFIDIEERTYNMNPEALKRYLEERCIPDVKTGKPVSKRTKSPVTALVPVHLYGQPADMDALQKTADRYGLIIIEDACQAHGAEYYSRKTKSWEKAGSLGKAAGFSFYPGKNLGAFGEAGAATTNDESLAKRIRMIRDHGQAQKYYHDIEGYNGRLDAVQAGILDIKLKNLKAGNEYRRSAAKLYNILLDDVKEVILPHEPEWSRSVYHLYVVRTADRAGLQKHLAGRGISTALHYPVPLHLQKAYAGLKYKQGDLPVAEKTSAEILSLPMFPGITEAQQIAVCDGVKAFVRKS